MGIIQEITAIEARVFLLLSAINFRLQRGLPLEWVLSAARLLEQQLIESLGVSEERALEIVRGVIQNHESLWALLNRSERYDPIGKGVAIWLS